MPKVLYCWRCRREVAMLDEWEWSDIHSRITSYLKRIQEHRATNGSSLSDAKRDTDGSPVLERYFELTGRRETDIDAISHHRLSLHGAPCRSCGKPLRTASAMYCAACGVGAVPARN